MRRGYGPGGAARELGRLPALDPEAKKEEKKNEGGGGSKGRGRRPRDDFARRFREILDKTGGSPRKVPDLHESSIYKDQDERED